jgi:rhodanese-related sulfurtransferase
MPIKNIDAATLKKWLDNKEAVLVDVREPAEFNAESIPEAKLIPLATVNKRVLPDCGNKKLVIHCRSGGRSLTACQRLLAEDATLELYNLDGGIIGWIQLGMPWNKNSKS